MHCIFVFCIPDYSSQIRTRAINCIGIFGKLLDFTNELRQDESSPKGKIKKAD